MKRVYGYIRRSREKENLSLQAQENSIRAFCSSQGWVLVGLFSDNATGENTFRSDYQRMLNSLKENGHRVVDLILVAKLDRMSRSLKDILVLIEDELDPCGIGLKSVTESFDSSTAEGRLLLSLLGGFAEFERKRIVERMMDGKYQLAENGGFTGGHIPYGYAKNPLGKGLVLDEKESKIVVQLFELFSSRRLSSYKLKEATSCPLHRDSISELLSNPLYAGLIDYNGALSKGSHEPLISVRLYNKVQELKAVKARNGSFFKIHGVSKILLNVGRFSGDI